MTTTTSHFQIKPDYYNSIDECFEEYKNKHQTNIRYRNFNQTHFTVGDEEQFQHYRYDKNISIINKNISLDSNIFNKLQFEYWDKYKNLDGTNVLETFRYLFNKFKKGIFVKIVNNELKVFLPFSNVNFVNEWSHNIKIDPKYKNLNDFLSQISNIEGRKLNKNSVNDFTNSWYGNNYLVRYEYPIKESDTNISCVKNMLEELCLKRDIPDIEFFINRRDFPLITKDGTEPYYHLWNSKSQKLVSHNYEKYVPILSMCNSENFADILIPTHEDWARVQLEYNKYFPKSHIDNNFIFNSDWKSKKSTAVFRGSSTGYGVDIETNQRLKVSYMSYLENKNLNLKEPYLDAGITKWNVRPRKFMNSNYLQTIEVDKLPFGLIEKMSPEEQSNYKYIIHIDGHVSAFRLSYELNMNSVILLVENEWKIWYSDMLIPFEHYVPVKEDLSDLIEKIEWCRKNDYKCKNIASNAKKFYDEFLSKNAILDFMQKKLVDIKNTVGNYFYNYNKPTEIQFDDELTFLRNSKSFPKIDKKLNKNSMLPIIPRSHGLLRGIQYTLYSINFYKTCTFVNQIFSNKLSCIKKYDLLGFKFSLKISTDSNKIKENIHETFVGNSCINQLLKEIPNFAYSFGIIEHQNETHIISEYIHGITLQEYISSSEFNIDDFIFIVLQICLALHVAQKKCLFVHNDLTPWNIILQKIKNPITVEYIIDHEKVLKFKTNIVPVIIDYGKSHVVYNNTHYGIINMFKFSTCTDILTLIITSLYQIIVEKKLTKYDYTSVLKIANFISNSSYHKEQFENIKDLKIFLYNAKKYSNLIIEDKKDLEYKTPYDLYTYLRKNLKYKYNIESNCYYDNTFSKIDSEQVFNFILSKSEEERNNTYIEYLNRDIDVPSNYDTILTYYIVQNVINNLKYYNTLVDNKIDINSLIEGLNSKIKKTKFTNVNISSETLENFNFNEDIFLSPEKIKKIKNDMYTDISDYKDIIEYVFLNKNFKISDKHKKNQKIKNILSMDSIKIKLYNANCNTIKKYAKIIYKNNIVNINSISDELINVYKDILKL